MFVDDPEGRALQEAHKIPDEGVKIPLTRVVSLDKNNPYYMVPYDQRPMSIWDNTRRLSGPNTPGANTFNLNGRTGKFWGGQIVYDDPNYVPFSQRPLQTTSVAPARELPQGISAGRAPVIQSQGNPNAEMMVIMPDGSRVPKSAVMAQLAQQRVAPVPVQRANANRDVNNVYSEAYAAQQTPSLTPYEYYQKYVLR